MKTHPGASATANRLVRAMRDVFAALRALPAGAARCNPWQAYVFAVLATAATLALRFALDAPLGGRPTLVIFTLPVMFSAYLGGWGPGLLATALCCLGASYYLPPPPIHSLAIAAGYHYWQQFLFLVAGLFISGSSEALHRARRRADTAMRQQHQTAAALRESENRLRLILQTQPECVKIVSREGLLLEMNPAGLGLLEACSLAEAQQKPLVEFIGPEYRDAFRALHSRVMAGGCGVLEFETVGLRGGCRWLETHAAPLRDSQGNVQSLLAVTRDITERKKAEITLRQSEANLAASQRIAHLGSWEFEAADSDFTRGALRWSDEVFRIWGYEPGGLEVSYENFLAAVHPDDRTLIGEAVSAALREHRSYDLTHRILRPGGEERVVREQAEFVFEEGTRRPIRMLGTVLDITAQHRAGAEIHRLNSELEERVITRTAQLATANEALEAYSSAVERDLRVAEAADRIKSAFLATMSHELRTPLNSILGFTSIVLQGLAGPLNPEQTKQLGMVKGSARHLLALINDVLDLSKIEAGQLSVHRERFDLRTIIERAADTIQPMADKKGLSLTVEIAPGIPEIDSDRRRVEQILLNLLSNAVKFTEHGGVTLKARLAAKVGLAPGARPQDALLIEVSDTGIGIKTDDLATLFQPFRQIDSGLARLNEGTGLGLAISRRLAILLDGTIHAASEWSKGSTFTVFLPLQIPADPCPEPSS